ncbi:hypothetical protein IMY05_C1068000100 [Salix suchowensis]|nr:hypothetical protein IMY05_C1068000100 [Salix suchowensis]
MEGWNNNMRIISPKANYPCSCRIPHLTASVKPRQIRAMPANCLCSRRIHHMDMDTHCLIDRNRLLHHAMCRFIF